MFVFSSLPQHPLCIICMFFYWLQLIQFLRTINCIGMWRIKTHNEGSEKSVEPSLFSSTNNAHPHFSLPLSSRGYMYAGLEFGAECYCGHKIQAPNASESECNMECKGEKSNLCGGANRLSIYRLELSQESARRCEFDTQQQKREREKRKTLPSLWPHKNHVLLHAHLIFELFVQTSIKKMWNLCPCTEEERRFLANWHKDALLNQKRNKPGCFEGKYLFYFGLMPQLGAGRSVVFTSFPGELCYLHNSASRGLHPKHSLPASRKNWSEVKEGRADDQKWQRSVCVEVVC